MKKDKIMTAIRSKVGKDGVQIMKVDTVEMINLIRGLDLSESNKSVMAKPFPVFKQCHTEGENWDFRSFKNPNSLLFRYNVLLTIGDTLYVLERPLFGAGKFKKEFKAIVS